MIKTNIITYCKIEDLMDFLRSSIGELPLTDPQFPKWNFQDDIAEYFEVKYGHNQFEYLDYKDLDIHFDNWTFPIFEKIKSEFPNGIWIKF